MIVGMLDYALSPDQLAELRQAHRRTRDKREADRIKAVVLLATGWMAEAVAEVLLVDPNTVRAHFKGQAPGGIGRPSSSEPVPLGQSGRLLGEGNLWGVLHGEWHDRSAAPVGLCVQEAPAGAWQGRPGSANAIPRNVRPYPQFQGSG